MTAAAVVLSYVLVEIDAALSLEAIRKLGWLYAFGPEGARAVLAAIAGSMITVAGLTFSITMLTLQLASSQFGPRLLRNVMRDRGNQVVLGTFISTFVYCLLVLRAVRGIEGASSVPHVSVAAGVLLALASLGVLIYFIHHVASAIRIETVLAGLAREANAAIDRLYPERLGNEPPRDINEDNPAVLPDDFEQRAATVAPDRGGYVQRIDTDALIALAREHDLVVRIEASPGRFVTMSDAALRAFPAERVSRQVASALQAVIAVGSDRSPDQDVAHALRLFVEIAQRALSPGVNDPTTALYCLDRLEEALERLATRELPSPLRFDAEGRLRVITEVATFEDLACPTLAAIARYGLEDADVVNRILNVIETLGEIAKPPAMAELSALEAAIRSASEKHLPLAYDRNRLSRNRAESGSHFEK
jgi:uncharacterized membrane protein